VSSLFVILNGDTETVAFKLPPVPPPAAGWHSVLDSTNGKNGDIPDFENRNQECPHFCPGETLHVPGRSVRILESDPAEEHRAGPDAADTT
jgi:hypothetical protein